MGSCTTKPEASRWCRSRRRRALWRGRRASSRSFSCRRGSGGSRSRPSGLPDDHHRVAGGVQSLHQLVQRRGGLVLEVTAGLNVGEALRDELHQVAIDLPRSSFPRFAVALAVLVTNKASCAEAVEEAEQNDSPFLFGRVCGRYCCSMSGQRRP